ncbi:PaaI family thioesterase [Natrialbaceae archaeon A-CW2]
MSETQPTASERAAALEEIRTIESNHGFIDELGIEFEQPTPPHDDAHLQATMPYHEEYANPASGGVLHGGIAAAVLDSVMGLSLIVALEGEERAHGPTMSLTTNYLAPVREPVVARATVRSTASRSAVIEGEIYGRDSGECLATAQGVWRVFAPEEHESAPTTNENR